MTAPTRCPLGVTVLSRPYRCLAGSSGSASSSPSTGLPVQRQSTAAAKCSWKFTRRPAWLRRFLDHAKGIAIVRAYTSSDWFHRHAVHAETMLFPKGKTKFIRQDGSIGRAPGHGVVLMRF
jgi:hypothetical protein